MKTWHETVVEALRAIEAQASADEQMTRELHQFLNDPQSRKDGLHAEHRSDGILLTYKGRQVLRVRVEKSKYLVGTGANLEPFEDRDAAVQRMAELTALALNAPARKSEPQVESE